MQIVKESIVLSSIRSFFNALFALIGIMIGLYVIIYISSLLIHPSSQALKPTVSIVPDANGNSIALPESTPIIMKLDIEDEIGKNYLKEEYVQNIFEFINQKPYKGRIKGLLLSISSPGGAVFDSNAIYEMVMDFKKKYKIPVYTHIKDLCASGGYYIACASDKIYATSVSIIGSVGVKFGPSFNYYDAMQKVGLKALTLTVGKNKEIIPQYSPLPEEDGKTPPPYNCLIDILHSQYMRFLGIVSNTRKNMDMQKLEKDYGAQVFIAKKAKEFGYIDEDNSTFNHALNDLVKAANITNSYQVLDFGYKGSLFESFASSRLISKVYKTLNIFEKFSPVEAKLKDSFLHLAQIESLAETKYE